MEMVYPITDMEQLNDLANYFYKHNFRNYVLFEVGINLGIRVSDFTDKTVGFYRNVCNNGYLEIIPSKTAKYHKKIRIPLQDSLKDLLEQYMGDRNDNEPMFTSREGGHLTRQHINRIIKEGAKAVGIKENVGCHSMRKTFGYWHYKNNKDIRTLMEIFKHSSEDVTLRYIGVTDEDIANSMKCMTLGLDVLK